MDIRAFITHKKAEHFADCQDRFSISSDTKSVAIADGMSQSYQQKIWAKLLVDAYAQQIEWVPSLESVRKIAPQWRENVVQFIQKLKDNNAQQYLIIMNENALASQKSAGATFVGIRFKGFEWTGDVLGDSCLIEFVDNKITNIYTSQQGDDFDNHPDYFDSDPLKSGKGEPRQFDGTLDNSTILLMVSDPFSDFLNEKKKQGNEDEYVKALLSIGSHQEFEDLVANWRDNEGMHNDDSTLIIIKNDGSEDFHIHYEDNIDEMIQQESKPIETEQKPNTEPAESEEKGEVESETIEPEEKESTELEETESVEGITVTNANPNILSKEDLKNLFWDNFQCDSIFKLIAREIVEPAINNALEQIYDGITIEVKPQNS